MRIRPVETSGLPMPFQRRGQGPVIVGSPDPLAWANKADGAKHAWDFIANAARWNGQYIGALANTPNWTFTRASTAYYRNSAGVLVSFASGSLRTGDRGALIEGARTNLCLQSQTFDNASWTKTRSSVSANALAAPDGTTTADKLVEDSTAANTHPIIQTITIANTTAHTWSCYLKAGERTWARLFLNDGTTNFGAYFNLSTGAVGTTTGSVTTAVTTLGSGWYRCAITFTSTNTTASAQIRIATSDGGDSYNGDGASGLYLWGAQLE